MDKCPECRKRADMKANVEGKTSCCGVRYMVSSTKSFKGRTMKEIPTKPSDGSLKFSTKSTGLPIICKGDPFVCQNKMYKGKMEYCVGGIIKCDCGKKYKYKR